MKTDFELPKWVRVEGDTKLIKCPKRCTGWLKKSKSLMVCDVCSMKSYESKLEAYWTRRVLEENREEIIRRHNLTPQDTYFCSYCRVHHVAGSKLGEMHLEYISDVEKLRVCSISGCNQMLTGKQKKYGCNKNCSYYENWRYTCQKCDYFFGKRGDGKITQRLCYTCLEREQGATIKDWEDLGLDPTVEAKHALKRIVNLKRKGNLTPDLIAAAERIVQFYSESKQS